jgi:hypothetical protein
MTSNISDTGSGTANDGCCAIAKGGAHRTPMMRASLKGRMIYLSLVRVAPSQPWLGSVGAGGTLRRRRRRWRRRWGWVWV